LDKKGEVEKIKHEQAHLLDYSISHNVVSGPNVIGARGCKDCHSTNSSFFLRKVLIDPYDEKGKPVYVEAWELLGISKDKLGRLLMEQ
jgi:formate-dependent nitrite reductase cytochrome c552 subunit